VPGAAWHDAGVEAWTTRAGREADLVAYYTQEVQERLRRDLPARRVAQRAEYAAFLLREGRRSVLEVGAGPGRDAAGLTAAGLAYTGVDLTPESVAVCRAAGFDVHVASVLDLPFPEGSFDAGWTMSTLLHVAADDLDTALSEIVRVLRPGAPLAVGTWGGPATSEGIWGDTTRPGGSRFFSIRTDEQWRAALGRHGAVEQWATWAGDAALHYQWAVLRTPGQPEP
jgi:SAM-dependent methyltransferase